MPDDTHASSSSEFVKHFISKKYGRARAGLSLDTPADGVVAIEFDAPGITAQRYRFALQAFADIHPDPSTLMETIVRTAIAHAHRDEPEAEQELPLLPNVRPWVGDFTDCPPGAGTAGYRRRSASTEERRQANGRLTACVELGLQMRQSLGRERVRSFLQGERVPPSVIRRVLSNAASRRQFRAEPK